MKTLKKLIITMRPAQWVKNLFVAAPALFAKDHALVDPSIFLKAAFATGTFILLASSVYILNDVLDIEKDRLHPVKSKRPVASGELSIQAALAGGLISLSIAVVLGYSLGPIFGIIAIGYLVLNVAYATFLKKIPWLDVLSIATGFLLRILAGSYAIGLEKHEISFYLLLCTFLVALFLALGKRRQELTLLGDKSHSHRSSLKLYTLKSLDVAMFTVAALTFAAYVAYTISPITRAYFGTSKLIFTSPFVLIGIVRFIMILRRKDDPRSPTDAMIHDWPFIINILAWIAVVVWAIYG